MGLTVLQINIRNFKKNKYLLSMEIADIQPDVILINESGVTQTHQLKLRGYKGIGLNTDKYYGIAIFIKIELKIEYVYFQLQDMLAIKLFTSMGPILIGTAYSPPKDASIPTISLNHLFSFKIPILFIGDLNGHSLVLNNCSSHRNSDNKGKQIEKIMKNFNLSTLGPDFDTFMATNCKGKPDVILCNNLFNVFNHLISPGNDVGSDHIPIIMKFQMQAFKIIIPCKNNLQSIQINKFKEELVSLPVNSLDGHHKSEISKTTKDLMLAIKEATDNNCNKQRCIKIGIYKPSREIKNKMMNYQIHCQEFYFFGMHSRLILHNKLEILLNLIKEAYSTHWKRIVRLASENFGNNSKFWKVFNKLRGSKSRKPTTYLKLNYENEDSDDSDYGIVEEEVITDKQAQADTMSRVWGEVFQENKESVRGNNNIRKVEEWFESVKENFRQREVIDYSLLQEEHPLTRPFTGEEVTGAIRRARNNAPGASGISFIQLKLLPKNCIQILIHIYNSILCTFCFPSPTDIMTLIFIPKPNKDLTNPENFRPICLIETVIKVFERVIANRLQYYLEYHNLLSERQFGFRPQRCTQHSISLIHMVLQSHCKAGKASLIATRDVKRAFDTVWHQGLLQKLYDITGKELEFIALIYNFLKMRKLQPVFQGIEGPIITPQAGVPQGSSLGPVLFSVFVNDHPRAAFDESIIMQFADDMIHIVCSGAGRKGRNRVKQAKFRMEAELRQTQQWEDNWKIVSNLNKSSIFCVKCAQGKLRALGGITVNNTNIPITNDISVLGATFSGGKISGEANVAKAITKAGRSLTQLKRFNNAPVKVKKYLYKALTRPVMEYPAYLNTNIKQKTKGKLQVVQNRALRFISNIKQSDRVKMQTLHEEHNIEAFNVRLDKLANKSFNKMKELYYISKNENRITKYKYSNFEINIEPKRKRRKSLAERIDKHLIVKRRHKNPIKWVKPLDKWLPPPSIYTHKGTP